MSAFAPQLIRAVVANTAAEAGRQLAGRSRGMGFLQVEGEDNGSDYADFGFDYNYSDPWNYGFDFYSGGGGSDSYFDEDIYNGLLSIGYQEGDAWLYAWQPLDSSVADSFAIDTASPFASPGNNTGGGGFDWGSFFDQLVPWVVPSFDAPDYSLPQYGPAGTGEGLPGYCPRGTYHPADNPTACIPFPPNDAAAKKKAQDQKKQAQQTAQQARKAQQQQNKACPKDPQGRPVWKNPATGKCELVPTCPQGSKFDPTTRKCLSAAQAKDLYGNDYTWVWWIAGAVAAAAVLRGFAGDSDSTKTPRRRTR